MQFPDNIAQKMISGARRYSTLNISETVKDRDIVTVEGTYTRPMVPFRVT